MQTSHPVSAVVLCAVCYVLCAVLAGCVKSGGPKGDSHRAGVSPTEPETAQQMSEFTLTGYRQEGGARWTLKGQGATLDGDIVTIHRPNAVGYDPGRTAYLTASLAQMNQQNRHVRMEHEVTVHTSDGLWFTSPVLHWIPDRNEVATDQSVRIETDHMLLRGRGMSGFTQLKHATIDRDIELVLNPTDHDTPVEGPSQVTITCDGPLTFDYEHNVATFEQNVHVKDPSGDLYSDKLIAYLDGATHTIRYADAIGRVRIHQDQNTALSERAVYEPVIGKITLVGRPSLLVYPSSREKPSTSLSFGGLIPPPTASPTAGSVPRRAAPLRGAAAGGGMIAPPAAVLNAPHPARGGMAVVSKVAGVGKIAAPDEPKIPATEPQKRADVSAP